jgi:hypothetical protein
MCYGKAFHGIGVQGFESLILLGALFLLDGGGEEKERGKKITMGREGFPRPGLNLLTVQWVIVVRNN